MIIIDRREPASLTQPLVDLAKSLSIETDVAELDFGDFHLIIPERGLVVGVERKTVSDLVSSLPNGRLAKQLHGLKDLTTHTYLLVEGQLNFVDDQEKLVLRVAHKTTGWTAPSILTYLSSLHLSGIGWSHTSSTRESLIWLTRFHEFLARDIGDKVDMNGTKHVKGTKTSKPRHDVAVLSQVPNVGPKTALKLLTAFGSIRTLMNADDATIAAVGKVGPAVVRSLRGTLGG